MKKFETLGVMIDRSRDAVMSLEGLGKFIPMLAKMGYNCIFLYTEDTYEVEGEPYFGYMRGRYSKEEMRAIDDLAYSYGIEVIPCIQTLAHLDTISRWGKFPMDTPGILLADWDKTYELIEKMFKTLSECFRTRRIHVGMDEAHNLGRGAYLNKFGYETVDVIMKKHLSRVLPIAEKYGYELMIWSDMFFRPWNGGKYSIPKTEIPKEYIEALPKSVIPVYWDYYSTNEQNYLDMMDNHKQLSKESWFAGGAWTWGGFLPHNRYTLATMKPAIDAARKKGMKHIFMTMWGDCGGECSKTASLPSLFYISEYAKGVTDDEKIKAKFKRAFGIDFDAFMEIDTPNSFVPGITKPENPKNPTKYMLYSDYFVGHLDYTVAEGGSEFFAECERKLISVAKSSRRFGYLFNTAAALSGVLKYKYDLGVRTRAAYQAGDKAAIKELAENDYVEAAKAIRRLAEAFEKQWMKENKSFGFEVHDIRLGGLIHRTEACRRRLLEYIKGETDAISELEVEILPYGEEKKSIYKNGYREIATSNVL